MFRRVTEGSATARTSVDRVTTTRVRRCRRSSCGRPAVATFTYVYADQTAVLGPLATQADPQAAGAHAQTLTASAAPQRFNPAIGPIVLVVFIAIIALAIFLASTGRLPF